MATLTPKQPEVSLANGRADDNSLYISFSYSAFKRIKTCENYMKLYFLMGKSLVLIIIRVYLEV